MLLGDPYCSQGRNGRSEGRFLAGAQVAPAFLERPGPEPVPKSHGLKPVLLMANSFCLAQEKRIMRRPETQIGDAGKKACEIFVIK